MRNLNIDHIDALSMLEDAADLLYQFEKTINDSLDGDHPDKEEVVRWLTIFEKYEVSE